MTNLLFSILGFIPLIFGANWLVGGASAIAKKKNISNLVIGLTIHKPMQMGLNALIGTEK